MIHQWTHALFHSWIFVLEIDQLSISFCHSLMCSVFFRCLWISLTCTVIFHVHNLYCSPVVFYIMTRITMYRWISVVVHSKSFPLFLVSAFTIGNYLFKQSILNDLSLLLLVHYWSGPKHHVLGIHVYCSMTNLSQIYIIQSPSVETAPSFVVSFSEIRSNAILCFLI